MTQLNAPPGWFPDPTNPTLLRYWDGVNWTQHTAYTQQRAYPAPSRPDPLDIEGGRPFVGPVRAFVLAMKQYAKFDGRSSRSEYWWFYLVATILTYALSIPGAYLYIRAALHQLNICSNAGTTNCQLAPSVSVTAVLLLITSTLIQLALLVPNIAVAVRRLHDTGRPGVWYLFIFVPLVGPILLIVWCAGAGQPGPNEYGLPPRKGAAKRVAS